MFKRRKKRNAFGSLLRDSGSLEFLTPNSLHPNPQPRSVCRYMTARGPVVTPCRMPAGTCIRSFAAGEAHIRVPLRDQRRTAAHHVPSQTDQPPITTPKNRRFAISKRLIRGWHGDTQSYRGSPWCLVARCNQGCPPVPMYPDVLRDLRHRDRHGTRRQVEAHIRTCPGHCIADG